MGNFQFYDPVSKVLFSGDLRASLSGDPQTPVQDVEAHVPDMRSFHQRDMCSNQILRCWIEMVRNMDMDIEMIVLQHGSPFVGKESIEQFLDWLWDLPCGVDVFKRGIFRCPA